MQCLSPAHILKGAAGLALLIFGSVLSSAQNADSQKIAKLFADIKEHSTLAQSDAETLEAYSRSDTSWRLHAYRLEMIKKHVNDLLADYGEMARLREEGSPWQQEAIDQLGPVLKTMAEHLNATILHQRENPRHVKMRPFLNYIRGNTEYVTKAATLIHDLVDYGAARSTADALQRELDLPLAAERK